MRIYLDTSAFVKRYSSEEGSSTINSLFESEHEKVRRRQITETERDLSISVLFSDILERNITFIKLSDEFLYPIIEKILAHHISADDALQLFSCIVSLSPVFLACDKNLLKAAKNEGLEAVDVEKKEDKLNKLIE